MLYFVYGSLLEGEYNHGFLSKSKKLCNATLEGFKMYSLGSFPTIIEADQNDIIYGEVYEVEDQAVENNLDMLEGYNGKSLYNFYDKKYVQVIPNNDFGQSLLAYVYYFKNNESLDGKYEQVKSGNWKLRNL